MKTTQELIRFNRIEHVETSLYSVCLKKLPLYPSNIGIDRCMVAIAPTTFNMYPLWYYGFPWFAWLVKVLFCQPNDLAPISILFHFWLNFIYLVCISTALTFYIEAAWCRKLEIINKLWQRNKNNDELGWINR